jgi:BASS family bile acid:Na+ symporter
MTAILTFLARRATTILAAGVFAGLVWPDLAAVAKPLLAPSVWGLLFLAAVRLDWAEVVAQARRPLVIAGVVAWLLVVSPAVMAGLMWWTGAPPGLVAALVLMAAAPPIMSSPAFSVLLGLDGSLSLVVMVSATVLAPLMLPIVALEVLDLQLKMGAGDLIARLGAMIGGALLAAAVARRGAGADRLARNAGRMDGIAVLLLVLFAVAIMDGVTERFMADQTHVLIFLAVAFAAYVGFQGAGAALFAILGRRSALTAGFSSANRNMALLLAVMPAGVDPDIPLYFALGQLPIYVLPAVLTPIYRWLLSDTSGARF